MHQWLGPVCPKELKAQLVSNQRKMQATGFPVSIANRKNAERIGISCNVHGVDREVVTISDVFRCDKESRDSYKI